MITIWFESHATTTDNEAKLASGWNDVDLSELGKGQTMQPIERSQHRNIQVIFTSDLQRAVKTGVPTANKMGIPIYIDNRLRECNYGDFSQSPKKQVDEQKAQRIGHRATQYGLEHHILGKTLQQCVTEPWTYQPGWKYEV